MRTRHWFAGGGLAFVALGLGTAQAADVAPPPTPIQPGVIVQTPPPDCLQPVSATTCKSANWIAECGHEDECWNLYNSARKATWTSTNPVPGSGKYFATDTQTFQSQQLIGAKIGLSNVVTSKKTWSQVEDQARYQATHQGVPPLYFSFPPATYKRNFSWDTIPGINSCEEYVYDKYYDVERWLDSIYACGSDARCQVNVSYLGYPSPNGGPPGIAGRPLHDKDGGVIGKLGTPLDGGWTAKNQFFAGTQPFFPPVLVNAFNAAGSTHAQKTLNALSKGADFYQIGTILASGGNFVPNTNNTQQGFKDEWEFHSIMNQRTGSLLKSPMTEGEFAEYKKRRDEVRDLTTAIYNETRCIYLAFKGHPCNLKDAIGHEKPSDRLLWEYDPFASLAVYSHVDAANALNRQFYNVADVGSLIASSFQLPTSGQTLDGFSLNQLALPALTSAARATGSYAMMGHLANEPTSAVVDTSEGSLGWLAENMWSWAPPTISLSPYPHIDCENDPGDDGDPFHVSGLRGQICELTNKLLLEQWRAEQLKPSCLALGAYGCDWSPDMFVERFVTNNVGYRSKDKEDAWEFCRYWTGGGYVTDAVKGVPVPYRAKIANFETYLKARKDKYVAKMKSIPVKEKDVFGTQLADSESWGNGSFGAKYAYDLGWHGRIYDRVDSGPAKDQICRMGGGANAKLYAAVIGFGKEVPLIDVGAGLLVNDDGMGNETGDASAHAHATFFGYDLFDPIEPPEHFQLNGEYTLAATTSSYSTPPLFVATVPIAWLDVTFSANVAMSYGATVSVSTGAQVPGQCDPGPIFKAGASITPFAELDLMAEADVSILGIVGVGVDCTLQLLRVGIPLKANVALANHKTRDGADSFWIDFNSTLSLGLDTLGGSVDAYVRLVTLKASANIISWQGLHYEIPIFKTPKVSLELFEIPPAVLPFDAADPASLPSLPQQP